ncbi:E3 ubiquitin-protein ligase RFI2-like isoform X2 [Raphanus sativus]|uniref:E3 ubiquitin-protein ligase RFI2-like isoform X2 n=1 Tax=Raphanus sativus TaxID=3726 RepID=A0A9W3C225_RAPSA|nr:E3 ubiquitin-protein ligase RFI2-like isoform X2 [Raphanus sativus]
MGLGNKVTKFDFDANDLAADDSSDGESIDEVNAFGSVLCSICIESVTKEGDRAWAKLHCGHEFHLDCIGSAFNTKGVMQCPNCRKVEKGQWLYSNGCRSTPEFSAEEWVHEEDIYDIGTYSEMAFGVHWCPFGSSARLPSFEDGDFSPSSCYFTEPPAAAPTAGHPCPYVTYFGPVHSSSSSTGPVSDSSSFPSHWNTGSGDVPPPYGFPVDPHYHGWDYHHHSPPPPPPPQHFSHVGSPTRPTPPPAAARTSRANGGGSDVVRPRPPHFMRPTYHAHSANGRAGSSVASIPRSPPFPGSNVRTRDRMQALQAYHQQSSSAQSPHQPDSSPIVSHGPVFSSGRRPSRGSLMGSTSSLSDQAGGSSAFIRFNIWEREPPYMPLQPAYPVNQMEREPPSIWTSSFNEGSGSLHQRHGPGGS